MRKLFKGINKCSAWDMKVLVVDDDPVEAELAVLAFEKQQAGVHRVIPVGDGVAALAYLCEAKLNAGLPDLILLDLHMPRMGGIAVLTELKDDSTLRQIPVIVFTNSNSNTDIEHVYRHNGNCYVVKPEDMQGMNQFVESLLRFWGQRVIYSPALK